VIGSPPCDPRRGPVRGTSARRWSLNGALLRLHTRPLRLCTCRPRPRPSGRRLRLLVPELGEWSGGQSSSTNMSAARAGLIDSLRASAYPATGGAPSPPRRRARGLGSATSTTHSLTCSLSCRWRRTHRSGGAPHDRELLAMTRTVFVPMRCCRRRPREDDEPVGAELQSGDDTRRHSTDDRGRTPSGRSAPLGGRSRPSHRSRVVSSSMATRSLRT